MHSPAALPLLSGLSRCAASSAPPLPTLRAERAVLRELRESDIDDRRPPIDPEEEDGYGSARRREWEAGAITHARI